MDLPAVVILRTRVPAQWHFSISLVAFAQWQFTFRLRSAQLCIASSRPVFLLILQATHCPARVFLHSLPPTYCCRSSAEFIMNFTSATLQSWHRSVASFPKRLQPRLPARFELVTPLRVFQLRHGSPPVETPFSHQPQVVPSPVSQSSSTTIAGFTVRVYNR